MAVTEYNAGLQAVLEFVRALYEAGVRHAVIAPGSRSTPLTIAFARHGQIKVWTVLDERSAGFFAYGVARACREPVVLVCTSGTAPANFFPAIIEAYHTQVPLLVMTADRPPELQGVGSNQTVDQGVMFGTFVKRFIQMPVPGVQAPLLAHARWTATRATALAGSEPKGPVHINWPFREPLLPPTDVRQQEYGGARQVLVGRLTLAEADLAGLAAVLQASTRGLIVCGPQDEVGVAESLLALAEALRYPLLADPLSQLRTVRNASEWVIADYDVSLRAIMAYSPTHPVRQALMPDIVLRVGQTPTSKTLGQYLASLTSARQVVIDGSDLWQDPFFTATDVWQTDPQVVATGLLRMGVPAGDEAFAARWHSLARVTRVALARSVGELADVFEGRVWLELAQAVPQGSVVFAGNSMPVRDLDSFFPVLDRPLRVFANRGASGIDGVVSSALGVSAANQAPVFLVIGDVSFFHDQNALLITKMHGVPLNVILIHNDGGGIFSFLPQATQPDVFDYFSTSHGLDFQAVVENYGGRYERFSSWASLRRFVDAASSEAGLRVFEIRTDRAENVRLHQSVLAVCADAIRAWGDGLGAGN